MGMCRVGNKLALHPPDADSPNWTSEWDIRNAKRSRSAVHRQNIRIIFTIGAKQDRDNLRVVKISLLEQWPQGPIDHAGRERFLFRWTAFTFEIAAREFSCRCRFFAIIDCEREIILALFDRRGRNGADEDGGVAARYDDGAIGESGDFAGFD